MSATFGAVVLSSTDPIAHATFYRELLGWHEVDVNPDWVRLRDPARERPGISFQLEPGDVPPAWPDPSRGPQLQAHLDILVDDLTAEVERALELGAAVEHFQPQPDVRVLRDPFGHLFCLFLPGA